MTKARPIRQLMHWLWQNTVGVRGRVLLCCLLGMIRVGLSLVFIWISKDLVDAAVDGSPVAALVRMAVAMVAIMLSEMAISLTVQYICNKSDAQLKNQLRLRLFTHLMYSRWIEHQDIHSGDLLNRLTEDVRQITEVACQRLQMAVVMATQFVGAFVVLAVLSWRLAMIVVFIMPVFVLLSKVYVKRTREYTAGIRSMDSAIHSTLQDSIQHHAVIQTMESESTTVDTVREMQGELFDTSMGRTRFGVFSRGMVQAGFISCYLTAFLWSVWSLHTGVITFGVMTAFLQLVSRIQMPVVNLSQHIPQFVHALTSTDRLMDIDGLSAEPVAAPVLLARPVGIKVDDISFGYPGSPKQVFSDFSHEFRPGSRTALMGVTGVGKSTLIKLLLALLTPDKGTITIYDESTSEPVSAATRCNLVYVPQGNSLLDRSVRDNLRMGNPEATEAEMLRALHTANADFVLDLPQGLDTRCGELGQGLSEGQAQRIAIARALLRKGAVLLMDEFNSSLDLPTAETLMQRLTAECTDRTFIFISHRPEVTAYCSDILRLEPKAGE